MTLSSGTGKELVDSSIRRLGAIVVELEEMGCFRLVPTVTVAAGTTTCSAEAEALSDGWPKTSVADSTSGSSGVGAGDRLDRSDTCVTGLRWSLAPWGLTTSTTFGILASCLKWAVYGEIGRTPVTFDLVAEGCMTTAGVAFFI